MPAMWQDIIDLNAFYASPLGQVARRIIRRRIRALWPNLSGQSVLGLGFATPYLRPFKGEASRVLAIMPATLGVIAWPPDEARRVYRGARQRRHPDHRRYYHHRTHVSLSCVGRACA